MAGGQSAPARARRPAARFDAGFAITCCAVLAAYNNIVAARPWHRRWYPLINAGATAVLLAVAAASGLTATDLGLRRDRLRPGLRLGGRVAAAAAGGGLLAAVLPATRPALRDERITALGGREIAYQVMVWIPVGTVVWEETAFRAVLQAALRRVLPQAGAVAVASGVFGIWHIRPTVEALRINRPAAGRRTTAANAAAAVAAATAGGVLLSWLRVRSGSLAAPLLLHLTINTTGALAAWSVAATDRRRGSRSLPACPQQPRD
jgi:membrane protease YdiL (CAAX protease family)